ncbi:MAG: hypothetical protein KatS3mg029_0642 [Saprospiraceae bacterium]|nr:MAG: hypothetical protein KatS3mg029_0642 [Saprospiraceae bacterium]
MGLKKTEKNFQVLHFRHHFLQNHLAIDYEGRNAIDMEIHQLLHVRYHRNVGMHTKLRERGFHVGTQTLHLLRSLYAEYLYMGHIDRVTLGTQGFKGTHDFELADCCYDSFRLSSWAFL